MSPKDIVHLHPIKQVVLAVSLKNRSSYFARYTISYERLVFYNEAMFLNQLLLCLLERADGGCTDLVRYASALRHW